MVMDPRQHSATCCPTMAASHRLLSTAACRREILRRCHCAACTWTASERGWKKKYGFQSPAIWLPALGQLYSLVPAYSNTTLNFHVRPCFFVHGGRFILAEIHQRNLSVSLSLFVVVPFCHVVIDGCRKGVSECFALLHILTAKFIRPICPRVSECP